MNAALGRVLGPQGISLHFENVFFAALDTPCDRDKDMFEANAYIQLPHGTAFEPVFQDAVNPNSDFDPFTAARARDGACLGGSDIVPVGNLLGIEVAKE